MSPRDLIEKDLVIMTLPSDMKGEVIDQLYRNAVKEIYIESRRRLPDGKVAELDKLQGVVDEPKLEAFLVEQVPQYFSLVTEITKNVLERFKMSLKEATEIHAQVSAQAVQVSPQGENVQS